MAKKNPMAKPKNQFKKIDEAQEAEELAKMPNPPKVETVEPSAQEDEQLSGFNPDAVEAVPAQPKEGDKVFLPNGDYEVFHNGTWIVKVQPNPHTGQDSQL